MLHKDIAFLAVMYHCLMLILSNSSHWLMLIIPDLCCTDLTQPSLKTCHFFFSVRCAYSLVSVLTDVSLFCLVFLSHICLLSLCHANLHWFVSCYLLVSTFSNINMVSCRSNDLIMSLICPFSWPHLTTVRQSSLAYITVSCQSSMTV